MTHPLDTSSSIHPITLPLSQEAANALLQGLVAISSLSTQEAAASAWLVTQMQQLGYDRAYVDGAGNAVGEMGPLEAQKVLILLGHIDTVPGNIPVRIEESAAGELLYGRGSVDAKGPLATFTAAVARIGSAWAHQHKLRLVVVGAVEEEHASSKGARAIRDRFNGVTEPLPIGCIIGEPSHWTRVTLGYKGRLLVEMDVSQPMAHTAGPDAGVATVAVAFWQWLSDYAARFNQGRDKVFDQLSPSLRKLHTFTDEQMHDHVQAQAGIRLPLGFDANQFVRELLDWAAKSQESGVKSQESTFNSQLSILNSQLSTFNSQLPTLSTEQPTAVDLAVSPLHFRFAFRSYEQAWRTDRNNFLVRSFMGAIRSLAADVRPSLLSKSGTSDMNVVGPAWPCPIVAYGPGDSTLDHTPHEHISLAEYWNAILTLDFAIRNTVNEG